MKILKILFLSILSYHPCFSQKAPVKFGAISKDLLEMKAYENDTSAAAVILCDYGRFLSNESKFVRVLRIKILKKEGYRWADNIFPTQYKADIKGITYNLENGEIVQTKLNKEGIYAERVTDKRFNMRVSMPNVKVGSVIDIKFVSDGFPLSWNFQDRIPVIWSELDIGYASAVIFSKNFFGYEPLFISEKDRWVGKDMPAFKEELFMNSRNNYMTRFEFDFSQITDSWDDVSHLLHEFEYFGQAMRWTLFLNDVAQEIIDKNLTDEEKIQAAFVAVKQVKWNGVQSFYASRNELSYIYKHKIGNSADINLTLILLLKKLGFEPSPVVLSTRENGMLSLANPSIFKLNHVIVSLKTDTRSYLLDATEEYMPFDLLPEKCLNLQGILLYEETGSRIDIMTSKKDKEFIIYNLNLNDGLDLSGQINYIRFDYAAYNFRKNYFSFNGKTEYLSDFIKNKNGLKILASDIKHLDSLNIPIEDKYNVSITNNVQRIGDEYYLHPLMYEQIKDNPFQSEKRNYPIDFAYKREKTITTYIQLPVDFEVVEIPKSLKMTLTGNAGSFLYTATVLDNRLIVSCKYSIDKELIFPEQYQEIKEFYNQIIQKHSQPIILKKKI